MIVECGSCGTRFQLDDARIPEAGIRVRCSKCKQAFFLPHPNGDATPTTSSPGETRNLGAADLANADSAGGLSDPGIGPQPPAESADDDEADWEFNDDRSEDGETPGGSMPQVAARGPSGIELGDDAMSMASEFEPLGGSIGDDEADDEFAAHAVPIVPNAAASPTSDATHHDASAEVDPGLGEDLGSPEEWDFLSDETLPPKPAAAPIGRVAVGPASDLPPLQAPRVERAATSLGAREPAAVWSAVGWGLCMALFTLGVVRGLLPGEVGASTAAPSSERVDVGALVAEGQTGHWIDTAGFGPVFVVSGELHNPTRNQQTADSVLRVVAYDADGMRLRMDDAFAGIGLRTETLREGTPSELEAAQREAEATFAHEGLGAGSTVRFEAVIRELPAATARLGFERVDVAAVATAPGGFDEEETSAAAPSAPSESATPVPQRDASPGPARVVGAVVVKETESVEPLGSEEATSSTPAAIAH